MTFPTVKERLGKHSVSSTFDCMVLVMPFVFAVRYDLCIHVASYLPPILVEIVRLNNVLFIWRYPLKLYKRLSEDLWLTFESEPLVVKNQLRE